MNRLPQQKKCNTCGEKKPLDDFCRDAKRKDLRGSQCKKCHNAASSKWAKENPERVRGHSRRWREAHRAQSRSITRDWRKKNPVQDREAKKAWRKKNPEKYKQIQRRFYINNREKVCAKVRDFRARNPDYQRQWDANNKPKRAATQRNRDAAKRNAEGTHTGEEIEALYAAQHGKCACCRSSLIGKYHADHVYPITRGGRNDIGNIQILCPDCNLRKKARDPIEFMQAEGFLL